MNKTTTYILVVIFLSVISLFFLFFEAKPITGSRKVEDSARLSGKQSIVKNDLQVNNIKVPQEPGIRNNSSVTVGDNKLRYEDDWCLRGFDLDEVDFNYSINQSDQWDLDRGSLNFKNIKDRSASVLTKSEALTISYVNMSNGQLLELDKQGDEIAAIALLDRHDLPIELRKKIAKKLIVLGKTGNALEYLVMYELINITGELSDGEELTSQQKSSLLNAIVYVNYGLDLYDISGLNVFLSMLIDVKENFELIELLSPEELDRVNGRLARLKDSINKTRADNNLGPLSDIDIPKIAQHDFKFDLAVSYVDFSESLTSFRGANPSHSDILKRGECVRRQITLLTSSN